FLQAAATMAFGIDFKTLGIRLGSVTVADMSFSYSRIITFGVALAAMLLLWLFLSRSYLGIAIRAISQDRAIMPLMGVDQRKIYLVTSAIGGALAGLAASLMVLQDRKSTRLNSSHSQISYAVFCLKKKINPAR